MTETPLYPLSEFTPAEARFDAAPTPPEVLREQVAREMWAADAGVDVDQLSGETPQHFYRLADAALAVFRGQQDPAVQRVCTCGAGGYATWHKSNCGLTR